MTARLILWLIGGEQAVTSDWLRHRLRLPCRQPVTGHEFARATDPAWGGTRLCIWLAHPQANRCFRPGRCHATAPFIPED